MLVRASLLVGAVALLYPPIAWFDRWAALPPGERERIGKDPLLPIANAMKLLSKRASFPAGDPVLHALAPVLSIWPALVVLASIPVLVEVTPDGYRTASAVLGSGIPWALVFGILLVSPTGYLVAARAGRNPLAVLGAIRIAVVRASVLLVFGLCTGAHAHALAAPSLDALVVAQQEPLIGPLKAWGALTNPLGAAATLFALVVFLVRANRSGATAVGDLVESHVLTVAGPLLLAQRVFEVLDVLALAALFATVFVGGASGWSPGSASGLDGLAPLVLVGKTLVVVFVLLTLRRALPPLRHDQALRIVWLALLPLAVAGLLASSWLGPG